MYILRTQNCLFELGMCIMFMCKELELLLLCTCMYMCSVVSPSLSLYVQFVYMYM